MTDETRMTLAVAGRKWQTAQTSSWHYWRDTNLFYVTLHISLKWYYYFKRFSLQNVLVSEFVRSGLNAGVLAKLKVDRNSTSLLANGRDIRQTCTTSYNMHTTEYAYYALPIHGRPLELKKWWRKFIKTIQTDRGSQRRRISYDTIRYDRRI